MIKFGPDGQPLRNADGTFVMEDVAQAPSSIPTSNDVATQLAAQRAHTDRLQADLNRRDEEMRLRALREMPQDQQVVARLQETERQLAQFRADAAQRDAHHVGMIRQVGLMAYRERAIRDIHPAARDLIPATLSSEQEIDHFVAKATQTVQQLEQQYQQQAQVQLEQERARQAQQIGFPAYSAYPQNPAFVAPFVAQGGFPSVTNPTPVPEPTEPTSQDLQALTSEQAVRTGKYSGEMREGLHARLRANLQYTGNLGTAPRHLAQPQHYMQQQQMPGGVMVPQGTPMGPVMNPNMPQGSNAPAWVQAPPQQQYAPPAPQMVPDGMNHLQYQPQYPQQIAPAPQYPGPVVQPGQAPMMPQQQWSPPGPGGQQRAAAQMAVAQTHAGTNPAMSAEHRAALAAANKYAGTNGIPSPDAAFRQRFAPNSGEN